MLTGLVNSSCKNGWAKSMLDIHELALNSRVSSYHEFLSRYSKTKKVVYGFVEGKEDPCFYRGFIEHEIPGNWEIELWAAGNKTQVYQIHKLIDWRRFPKKRICFFVDRDLSDLIPEKLIRDVNIYVTDGYSIENDIVNRGTCKRILAEVFGFENAKHEELDKICGLFEQEFEKFLLAMIPVMAWILCWHRDKKRAGLNIHMPNLFSLSDGYLQTKAKPKGKDNLDEYLHGQCNVAYDRTVNISIIQTELRNGSAYRDYTRGKYVFWFLVEFCLSVKKSMHVTLSASNGMAVIGNRARIPNSLRQFLNNTFSHYIAMKGP